MLGSTSGTINATYDGGLVLQFPKETAEERNERLRGLIKKVIFNGPVTVVLWNDGTKTVVRKDAADPYDAEKAVLACMAKKLYENTGVFNEVVCKWVGEQDTDVRLCNGCSYHLQGERQDLLHTIDLQQNYIDSLEKKLEIQKQYLEVLESYVEKYDTGL